MSLKLSNNISQIPWVFQYFVRFSLTFPVCTKFPDFSLTGKCLPTFPGFPVRVGTLLDFTIDIRNWNGLVAMEVIPQEMLPWIRTLNHCFDPPSNPGFHDNVMLLCVWLTNVTSNGGSGRPAQKKKNHFSLNLQSFGSSIWRVDAPSFKNSQPPFTHYSLVPSSLTGALSSPSIPTHKHTQKHTLLTCPIQFDWCPVLSPTHYSLVPSSLTGTLSSSPYTTHWSHPVWLVPCPLPTYYSLVPSSLTGTLSSPSAFLARQ